MGKAYKFGDHINTDLIIPARYLNVSDPQALAAHCMEDADATFAGRFKPGDVLVGGEDFGCGSSREHAPIAIRACGASCVIAASYARIFFRNSINIGLPIFACREAAEAIADGDEVEVDLQSGLIRDLTSGRAFQAEPFSPYVDKIIRSGGLMNLIRREKHE
ncbi:MAG: 3-isopropylmalate dehydratase small subunit [Eubacteriales bacterium]|nr:3-isopropylmalate dehydratase small subunit [Eubacteriales bacterium]